MATPPSSELTQILADARLVDVLLCFGLPATAPCDTGQDVNGDGTVNVLDLIDLLLAFGTSCP